MRTRLGARWEVLFDAVSVITVIVVTVHLTGAALSGDPVALPTVLLIVGGGLVVARRRAPLLSATASILTSGLVLLTPDDALGIWVLAEVCLFSLPLRRSRRWAVAIASVHAAVLYVGAMVTFGVGPLDSLALIMPAWTGAVVAFGSALRAQEDYLLAVEERGRVAAAARESELLRRVGEERVNIARDLHDSVANSLAVITLHAINAERHVIDDPARAGAAMATVRSVSKMTLAELASILAVLREDRDRDEDRTIACVASIPHLVSLFTSSGVAVHTDVADLIAGSYEPAVDAALYRVAQEALTNAYRHGAPPFRIVGRTEGDNVVLQVTSGLSSAKRMEEPGFGIVGMKERVTVAGGALTIEGDDATFIVRASFPVRRRSDASFLSGPDGEVLA
ncbi:sensor histidine kinase [Microbacterium oleivorans]|uniref:histidine kinase n=1 Tax=Microbacterium oleivorans TaxID=273677 RepID=A0A4R5YK14_9MICO|nr:histidine kinase [Microbacterium oleivorans]TDL45268.1 hypothetical protein E2R54_02040 [Microbacterium oleivorans]